MVLSAFVAIAFAAPSGLHHEQAVLAYSHSPSLITKTHIHEPVITTHEKTVIKPELTVVEQPTVHHVGNIVKSFPTAVSHQSQTIVHSKADVVEPILAHGVQKHIIETPKIEKHLYQTKSYPHTKTILTHHQAPQFIESHLALDHHQHFLPSVYAHHELAHHDLTPVIAKSQW